MNGVVAAVFKMKIVSFNFYRILLNAMAIQGMISVNKNQRNAVMKKILRYVSFMAAVAILMSTCMVAFAREKKDDLPTAGNCAITVEGEKLTVSGSYTATTSYSIKDNAVTFSVDGTGLVLTCLTPGGNVKTIRLGKHIYAFTVSGTLDSLTLSEQLDYHYTVTVDAAVDQLTAYGDVRLLLAGETAVNTLTLESDKAVITAESGVEIQHTNRALDSDTYLTVAIRDYRANTAAASYDSATGVLSLQADRPGCTVNDALKDVVFSVRRVHGDLAVAGQWYWPNLDGGAAASGRYLYRFAPSQGAGTQELTIEFAAVDSAS